MLPRNSSTTPSASPSWFITDWVTAGLIGRALLYVIRHTGHDLTGTVYVFAFGALMALDFTRASLSTPLPNLPLLFPHLALEGMSGWFIGRYDDLELNG